MAENKIIHKVNYDRGSITIDVNHWSPEVSAHLKHNFQFDHCTNQYRALAQHYGASILALHQNKIAYEDAAKNFTKHNFTIKLKREPRPYQSNALNTWLKQSRRGTIVLPTGAGKSFLAMLAIEQTGRDTLICVPTIDLMSQWAKQLEEHFEQKIGLLGGGSHDIQNITVSTYDSALIHIENIGNRFGLLIADECHHLPGPSIQSIAKMSIAPFRLGLTATPERSDGGEALLQQLIGPIVFSQDIHELKGQYLSHYDTKQILIPLNEDEHQEYQQARDCYKEFVRNNSIDFSRENGWAEFLQRCFSSEDGRTAYRAYRRQKEIIKCSNSKMDTLWQCIQKHHQENIIIFTDDNMTAYKIGNMLMLPVLTHNTKANERKVFLQNFKEGIWPYIVTSKVLNEGVDVPEASVGIIVSGSGSTREHVQRLGRILRHVEDKKAVLYELISKDTGETYQSQRRRMHRAYERTPSI